VKSDADTERQRGKQTDGVKSEADTEGLKEREREGGQRERKNNYQIFRQLILQ
jgi:hypothetical protein